MKMVHHKELTLERWEKLSLCEQMANVGSEVARAMSWRGRNEKFSRLAVERALELLDLTLEASVKRGAKLRELARVREALVDYFYFSNDYGSSDKTWHNYFGAFNYAAKNPLARRD
jgi:hypothetical protein